MSQRWKKIALYTFYTVMIIVVGGAFSFKVFQPIQVLPRIRLAPGFSVVMDDGERLTNEDMRGKLALYSFTYTRCQEPDCQRLIQTMLELQDKIDTVDFGGTEIQFVTITVDPEHDTQEALRAYAESIGADPALWHFARIDDPMLLKYVVGGGFETYYDEQEDGRIQLDPSFVLVDGWGIVRGEYHYRTLASDSDRILRHLDALAEEIRNSTGVASLAYEAAHYFLCYTP